jgi:hypothetical protein
MIGYDFHRMVAICPILLPGVQSNREPADEETSGDKNHPPNDTFPDYQ